VLKGLAAEAGLEQAAFDDCLDSGRHAAAINADLQEGSQLGVQGTPAFFVNGQFISGAQPFAVFDQAIQQALEPTE
jgi:protein-disulfide isomerase